jgi:hypothetical protein
VVGFEDETWCGAGWPFPRCTPGAGRANLPLRLEQRSVTKDDPDPKAISCYGPYLPELDKQTWLRFVEGRAVSGATTRFLSWCSEELAKAGKKVLVLVRDNASWHISGEVRRWMGEHNRRVKKGEKEGVRIISRLLPKKSPWLRSR